MSARIRAVARRVFSSTAWLWSLCILVHGWVVTQTLLTHDGSFGDVQLYRWWVDQGIFSGSWPVLTSGWEYETWVYPVLALVPMLLAAALGSVLGTEAGWLVVALAASVGAFTVLARRPRWRAGAWYWLAFLAALGPIALVRLDVFVAATVLIALALTADHPRAAALLLTLGAWIKVVPAAVVWSVFAVTRRRWRDVVVPAGAFTVVVMGSVAAFGGGLRSLSFLSEQGERGLQLESVGASVVLAARSFGVAATAVHNNVIYTWELEGAAAEVVATVLPVVLVVALVGVAALTWFARRSSVPSSSVLTWSALAFLSAAIVGNKVGSPQFQMWLLAPLAMGLAYAPHSRAWRGVGIAGLVAALATQYTYPFHYGGLLNLEPWSIVVLGVRNGVVVGIFLTASYQLLQSARQHGRHR